MVDAVARRRSGRRLGTLAAARGRSPGGVAWASRRVDEGVRQERFGRARRQPRTPGQDAREDVMNGVRPRHQPSTWLEGRTALVSGGLGDIGRAIALRLARAGADVAVGDVAADGGGAEELSAAFAILG